MNKRPIVLSEDGYDGFNVKAVVLVPEDFNIKEFNEKVKNLEKINQFRLYPYQIAIKLACMGEAHFNPHIDNCGVCCPLWGRTYACGYWV